MLSPSSNVDEKLADQQLENPVEHQLEHQFTAGGQAGSPRLTWSAAEDKAIVRKFDLRVMPLPMVLLMMCFTTQT